MCVCVCVYVCVCYCFRLLMFLPVHYDTIVLRWTISLKCSLLMPIVTFSSNLPTLLSYVYNLSTSYCIIESIKVPMHKDYLPTVEFVASCPVPILVYQLLILNHHNFSLSFPPPPFLSSYILSFHLFQSHHFPNFHRVPAKEKWCTQIAGSNFKRAMPTFPRGRINGFWLVNRSCVFIII